MHDHPREMPPLLEATALCFRHGDVPVLDQLSFCIHPGLTLVSGGDGRGKTTLLRLMAGLLEPTQGRLRRATETTFYEDMADPAHDAIVASHWLQTRRLRFADWDTRLADDLLDAFGLADHIDKPLYMLSTGSRRKVALLAAAASSAQLRLIDTPFAALDAPSRRVLTELLTDAANGRQAAWVIADYALPEGLNPVQLSGRIQLGD